MKINQKRKNNDKFEEMGEQIMKESTDLQKKLYQNYREDLAQLEKDYRERLGWAETYQYITLIDKDNTSHHFERGLKYSQPPFQWKDLMFWKN